ncbi:ribonuclease III [Pseudoramibacter alactolyticus]|uniref:ribonuclease III n=1 Tax=Pseudoramibacter alactolyticus TaxID=113287 RepID=UPI00235365F6|nr:ribonuclease III [Pseudoramibacter alactolyticus]MBM6968322.1 ribonuclease III [Pseudoramibacter alactolyticus]
MEALKLQQSIGYIFKNQAYLHEALTHSSHGNSEKNNERLEYLGDAVLELSISDYLFKHFDFDEGKMTKLRASIVCSESLSQAARRLHLGNYLHLGKGEVISGGRSRQSILENAFEAMLGAIFLDSDYSTSQKKAIELLSDNIETAIAGRLTNDYKTALQELIQKQSDHVIEYVLDKADGPEHDKTFFVTLMINGQMSSNGRGKTKKEAEQQAAKKSLHARLRHEKSPSE